MKLAPAAAATGELLQGGAFADPVGGAALVFKAADQSVAKRFAVNDPYVTAGLVTKWAVRKRTVVVETDRRLGATMTPPGPPSGIHKTARRILSARYSRNS